MLIVSVAAGIITVRIRYVHLTNMGKLHLQNYTNCLQALQSTANNVKSSDGNLTSLTGALHFL